jgi:serine/threonine-protein kinase
MDQPEFRLREIWPPGTVIKDDYIIERRLGSGGFGTVYLARHRFLQSQHVIKRLHEQLASDEVYVRKFIREGQSIRKLRGCPYIVDIEHMTQTADGHLILIMEYVPGGDLEGYLKTKGRLEIAEALDLASQIAEGLKAAHAVGLLHRDIKPQNVLLARRPDGSLQAKLIDFGIAANQETQQSSALRGGSLGYAAPEQWMMSGKNLDARVDLYSLGAALYRMLTGRMPYNAEDIGDWMAQARNPPPRPATLVANVPPDLDRLLLELLAPSRENRPPNAESVITRMHAMTQGAVTQRAVPNPVPVSAPARRRLAWLAVPLLAVAGLGGWLATRTPSAPAPEVKKAVETAPPPKPVEVAPAAQPPAAAPERTPERVPEQAKEPPAPKRVPEQKPVTPAVDYLGQGDAARDRGDYRAALKDYRQAESPDKAQRLAQLQHAVEGDVEERVAALSDSGQFTQADALVSSWLAEYPSSSRLQAQKALIRRRKESQ